MAAFVSLIHSEKMMQEQLREANIDLDKMPLGSISDKQVRLRGRAQGAAPLHHTASHPTLPRPPKPSHPLSRPLTPSHPPPSQVHAGYKVLRDIAERLATPMPDERQQALHLMALSNPDP